MRELVEVLAEHQVVATGLGEWACKCSPRTWRPSAHRAKHLAEAVLAHLREVAADEGVRERVARVLANRCGRGLDLPIDFWGDVGPVLTPFLDALGGTEAERAAWRP